jgi:hypothetical protein
MVAASKQELHALIDQLSDDDAAETLAYVRQLLGDRCPSPARPQSDAPARPHALPTLHRASAILSIRSRACWPTGRTSRRTCWCCNASAIE